MFFAKLSLAAIALSSSMALAQTQSTSSAPPAQSAPRVATDEEVTKFLSKYVFEINDRYLVYNWFSGNNRDPIWATNFPSDHPAGLDHLKSVSRRFWQSFCTTDTAVNPPDCDLKPTRTYTGNVRGDGLYAAIDPLATMSYGGFGPGWVLMQIELPKGLRVMDARGSYTGIFPPEIAEYFSMGGRCAQMNPGYLTAITNLTSEGLPNECRLLYRKVLKDLLKIDAIMYGYSSARLPGINYPTVAAEKLPDGISRPFADYAFVIADAKAFKASDIKIFNSQSRDAIEDRWRLHTLFKANRGQSMWADFAKDDAEIDDNVRAWIKEKFIGVRDYPPYTPLQESTQGNAPSK